MKAILTQGDVAWVAAGRLARSRHGYDVIDGAGRTSTRAANCPDVGIGGEIDHLLLMQADVEMVGGIGLKRDSAVVADDVGHHWVRHERRREEGADFDCDEAVGVDFCWCLRGQQMSLMERCGPCAREGRDRRTSSSQRD